jgi:2-dehydro-3-deoxygalactonokinase
MSKPAFLALDWGTTNLRAWLVADDGSVSQMQELPFGVSRIGKGEAAATFHDKIRPAMKADGLPTIIAGMAGSTLGWVEAPYVDCPADADSLSAQLTVIQGEDPPVAIVPGLRGHGVDGPDVMRGEETQLIGWLAEDETRRQGRRIVCHPGTHAKWVLVEDGRIVRFVTAMTGELFAVMTTHSVLRTEDGPPDDAAFTQGLEAAGDGSALAARLFTARARMVGGGGLKAEQVRSYLSGLLIGADVIATPKLLGAEIDTPIALIGDAKLCASYKRAMDHKGLPAEVFDGEDAVLSGLKTLFAKSQKDMS